MCGRATRSHVAVRPLCSVAPRSIGNRWRSLNSGESLLSKSYWLVVGIEQENDGEDAAHEPSSSNSLLIPSGDFDGHEYDHGTTDGYRGMGT